MQCGSARGAPRARFSAHAAAGAGRKTKPRPDRWQLRQGNTVDTISRFLTASSSPGTCDPAPIRRTFSSQASVPVSWQISALRVIAVLLAVIATLATGVRILFVAVVMTEMIDVIMVGRLA